MAPAWTSSAAPPARRGPPAASPDDTLVAAAAAGAPLAFARLVERRQQALRAFLRRLCGDWALADDLAQETFLAAWSNLGRLRQGADVAAWLFGIGYHKYLGARRGARRACARETLWGEETAESGAFAPEDRLALKKAMADLPVERRACVALCLAAGYSHAQAAEALGLPAGTVKSHVARGKARLLAALGESP
jgi:RNA polymerase sigma-70 factor (ECF subfamily)